MASSSLGFRHGAGARNLRSPLRAGRRIGSMSASIGFRSWRFLRPRAAIEVGLPDLLAFP
jgi:hypothetical protein